MVLCVSLVQNTYELVHYRGAEVTELRRERKNWIMKKSKKSIDAEIFERQARICKAFAHPARLQILDLLGQGEQGVSQLQETMGISKTGISQHLAILKSAGVVATRRNGKQIYCSLAMPEVKQACQLIRKVLHEQIKGSHRLIQ